MNSLIINTVQTITRSECDIDLGGSEDNGEYRFPLNLLLNVQRTTLTLQNNHISLYISKQHVRKFRCISICTSQV